MDTGDEPYRQNAEKSKAQGITIQYKSMVYKNINTNI